MKLTRTGDYALRAMMHLALIPDGMYVHITDISARRAIPEKFLRKIIPKLSRARLIKTIRGREGGIALDRPADLISMLDIIESVEGPLFLNLCLISPAECRHRAECEFYPVWHEAQVRLKELLGSRTLANLIHGI